MDQALSPPMNFISSTKKKALSSLPSPQLPKLPVPHHARTSGMQLHPAVSQKSQASRSFRRDKHGVPIWHFPGGLNLHRPFHQWNRPLPVARANLPGGTGPLGCIYTASLSRSLLTNSRLSSLPTPASHSLFFFFSSELGLEVSENAGQQDRRGEPPGGVRDRRPQGGARRVHLHAHLRLRRPGLRHGIQQAEPRRRGDPGRPDLGGDSARLRAVRGGVRGRQHLRRAREPGGDLRRLRGRQHHPLPRPALLGRPAAGLHRRLLPPPLLHRRAPHRHLRAFRHRRVGGGGARDRHDLRAGVHGVRHRRGPQERQPGHHRAHRHRLHRRRQHPGRRRLLRRFHEPRRLLRPRPRQLGVGVPVGVLGRPPHRRRPRRRHLRAPLHLPHPRAAPHHRLLSKLACKLAVCRVIGR